MKLKRKFIKDLGSIITDQQGKRSLRKKVVLLSGGVDSILLLSIMVELFGARRVRAITICGTDHKEEYHATLACRYFKVSDHVKVSTCSDDVIDCINSDLVGIGYTTVFSATCDAILRTSLSNKIIPKNSDVIAGEGADSLYGSTSHFAYMDSTNLFKREDIPLDEARTILKAKYQAKIRVKREAGLEGDRCFKNVIESLRCNAVLPYLSDKHKKVEKLPFSIVCPNSKRWARSCLRDVMRVPNNVVPSKRIMFQKGTGIYDIVKKVLSNKKIIEICKIRGGV